MEPASLLAEFPACGPAIGGNPGQGIEAGGDPSGRQDGSLPGDEPGPSCGGTMIGIKTFEAGEAPPRAAWRHPAPNA